MFPAVAVVVVAEAAAAIEFLSVAMVTVGCHSKDLQCSC